jgi:hypothetical protein
LSEVGCESVQARQARVHAEAIDGTARISILLIAIEGLFDDIRAILGF